MTFFFIANEITTDVKKASMLQSFAGWKAFHTL